MTGDPNYGQAAPEAMAALLAAPPTERAAYIESAQNWTIWASKKYANLAEMRDRAGRDFDRSFYPEGSARQLAAIFAVGDRVMVLRGGQSVAVRRIAETSLDEVVKSIVGAEAGGLSA